MMNDTVAQYLACRQRVHSLINLTKEFSIMIIETKGYSCRKRQSEGLVKNGTNASGSSQYHCKACGA